MTWLRSALFALALVLVTPPYAVVAMLSFPLPRMARYRLISAWSRLVVWLAWVICGIRWKLEGRKHLPDEPAVILSQHQSAWETLAYQEIFPPQVLVLKRELLWIPFFGWGLALMSPIAINRARGTAALREMARQGRERLALGFWVVIFPEGTRVPPGGKRPYHQGGAWLAVNCGVPVVPVAHNAGRLWPRNAFLKRAGTVTVRVGPPIGTEGRQPQDVIAEVKSWIEAQQATL
jgi:1-acyl-sn-glycerol-3-phosphate acyltransferase